MITVLAWLFYLSGMQCLMMMALLLSWRDLKSSGVVSSSWWRFFSHPHGCGTTVSLETNLSFIHIGDAYITKIIPRNGSWMSVVRSHAQISKFWASTLQENFKSKLSSHKLNFPTVVLSKVIFWIGNFQSGSEILIIKRPSRIFDWETPPKNMAQSHSFHR